MSNTVGSHSSEASAQAAVPASELIRFEGADEALQLECGFSLEPWQLAYQTYGRPDAQKSNAILVCHALTLDQHVANPHPITNKPGWWSHVVGPGLAIDTDHYWVICANVLGSCMGTTGPASCHPERREPWGSTFPVITITDMVRAQTRLLKHLEIREWLAVVGGSMGGMQVLTWASHFPECVRSAIPIATAARHTSQNIAFHEVGRQAILADHHWHAGQYFRHGVKPRKGLAVARMAAHITYLSEAALHQKFGRNLQDRASLTFSFDADFQVESYLRHQGHAFVDRFDATSYLYLTRAMDYFDLASDHGGLLANAFLNTRTRYCVISFSSDWLFPTVESKRLVRALIAAGADVSFVEIESDRGHDTFLLDSPDFCSTVSAFLSSVRSRQKGTVAR